MRRAPAKPVRACCVRVCCTLAVQDMTCTRRPCTARPREDFLHTSQFHLNILHFTSHTSSHLKPHFSNTQNFYTEKLSSTASFYTEQLLDTEAFTQRSFYRQKLLHTEALMILPTIAAPKPDLDAKAAKGTILKAFE